MQDTTEPAGVLVHYTNIQGMSRERTTMLYSSAVCHCKRNDTPPILTITETHIRSTRANGNKVENQKKYFSVINEFYRYRSTSKSRLYVYKMHCDSRWTPYGGAAICIPTEANTELSIGTFWKFSDHMESWKHYNHLRILQPCSNGVAVTISLGDNKLTFLLVCVYRYQKIKFNDCAKHYLDKVLKKSRDTNGRIPVVLVGDFNLSKITSEHWTQFNNDLREHQEGSQYYEDSHEEELGSDKQFLSYLRELKSKYNLTFQQHIDRKTNRKKTQGGVTENVLDLLLPTNDVDVKERLPIRPCGTSMQDNFRVVFTPTDQDYHSTILFSVSKGPQP